MIHVRNDDTARFKARDPARTLTALYMLQSGECIGAEPLTYGDTERVRGRIVKRDQPLIRTVHPGQRAQDQFELRIAFGNGCEGDTQFVQLVEIVVLAFRADAQTIAQERYKYAGQNISREHQAICLTGNGNGPNRSELEARVHGTDCEHEHSWATAGERRGEDYRGEEQEKRNAALYVGIHGPMGAGGEPP